MGLHLGIGKVDKIFLGTREVHQIYLGTELVYVNSQPVLFDYYNMQQISVSGDNVLYKDISWSGNLLERPNYTASSVTNYSFEDAETLGCMKLIHTGKVSGSISYNSHVCTTNLVTIPRSATAIKLFMNRNSVANTVLKFGLLPENAANSMDTTAGGVMDTIYPTNGDNTYTVNLGTGMAGNKYRAVINIQAAGNINDAIFRIYRVWFE